MLQAENLDLFYGASQALRGVGVSARMGEVTCVLGRNGVGKTTMMDVISGRTRPDDGVVLFRGDIDLTELDEAAIAQLGIGRKFQKPTVFESQTVFENLELALAMDRGLMASLFHRLAPAQRDRIDEILETEALRDSRGALAGSLSHGQKQWLEIGMLLMQDPDLLMVDEPVAGMTDAETEQTAALLREIAGSHSVLVVEHDMEFVRALDTRVTVLHEGAVLPQGSLETVQNNERVIEVYLGR